MVALLLMTYPGADTLRGVSGSRPLRRQVLDLIKMVSMCSSRIGPYERGGRQGHHSAPWRQRLLKHAQHRIDDTGHNLRPIAGQMQLALDGVLGGYHGGPDGADR